jgi:hypothetical protein
MSPNGLASGPDNDSTISPGRLFLIRTKMGQALSGTGGNRGRPHSSRSFSSDSEHLYGLRWGLYSFSANRQILYR